MFSRVNVAPRILLSFGILVPAGGVKDIKTLKKNNQIIRRRTSREGVTFLLKPQVD